MADLTRRIEAWRAKTTPERTKEVLEARRAEMQRRYEAAMAEMCAMEEQVKAVLNSHGIHTSNYVPYLNYGRQLWKLTREGISGESFALAAKVLLEKWAARNLDPKVLAAIRTEVFNIGEPKT
ncbi:MAG: hypothetical protein ABIK44_06820 [candidate division WOR-3 bacterium]